MRMTFLGAAGTVTGSKYLLEHRDLHVLIDCGLFQGYKQLRLHNWDPFQLPVQDLHAIVLTHAHLDHCGYLPVLVRNGYRGPVYATQATCELAKILLRDSARLQEEEAEFANRHGFSKHAPALPLYTEQDAERALTLLRPLELQHRVMIAPGLSVLMRGAGHILGAATLEIVGDGVTLVCSGDLGRPNDPLMYAPQTIEHADYLLVESTYGDRRHPVEPPEVQLAEVINRTALRHGITLVPSFAVGRAQLLMYHLYRLKQQHAIPDLPIYLNSPMATDVTRLYQRFRSEHRLSLEDCQGMCDGTHFVRSVQESIALDLLRTPAIIIAASGMATGGRVLHHLKALAPNPLNTLLVPGFQAGGTRGAHIVAGAPSVRIHGQDVPIRAEVVPMETLSAHADADEIMQWLRGFKRAPKHTYVVHGEPNASDVLRQRISQELGWSVSVPEYRDCVELPPVDASAPGLAQADQDVLQ
ncbi:MBL fold metallo-hydrolase [Pseudomonas extremaustralis]|jgi:metallo-beta-lactamase family protein|uniref:MBL fold metallo-hydrolase n=1 Tax=Pseudomonas extremaustralis TaxID=359110 RepID=A0A5C5QQD4_9PSED|nr:MBL fold metallo-hydrolase [Pseudomonas extremaustralis]EZI30120.1 mRNA 3'-end processing factor [Pseudomonas extremaustralis 14-3 substr. 14-3b]MDF3133264.1 MBL fold metallo-hydrolase [Pseudomonas extremaustralis]MDG2965564.1 MBL fold metallo-hydrolase [Pseudomonas extremaustralis]TWS07407.1 MBL fold metallo-hydrolase [Pseudomonas extremaustralis]UUJ40754.1 MBL fold metallo-hydrolase [Pseudomonas extremaustralis]